MGVFECCCLFCKDSTTFPVRWKTQFVTRNYTKVLPACNISLYHIFVSKDTKNAFRIGRGSFRGPQLGSCYVQVKSQQLKSSVVRIILQKLKQPMRFVLLEN